MNRRRARLLAIALAAPVLLAGAWFGGVAWAPRGDALDRGVARLMQAHDLPGAVVAFGQAGSAPEIRAYGLAEVRTGRPVAPETAFRLASLSKPVTAAAVLALVEGGELELETRLGDLFPELARSTDPRLAAATLADLLRHSAGWDRDRDLEPFFLTPGELRAELGLEAARLADCAPLARAMAARPLQFAPGARYAYSNLGYCWLGLVLTRATGQPYAEAVAALVPEASGFRLAPRAEDARPHRIAGTEEFLLHRPAVLGPAGGWRATAEALFRFAARPLPQATTARPPYAAAEDASFYGLGWRVWQGARAGLLTHYGAMPGSFAVLARHADGRLALALFNARPADDLAAFEDLLGLFGF